MSLNQLIVFVLCLLSQRVFSGELTFELPDSEKMCFYENIEKGIETTMMFQVVLGGNYDVDLEVKAPNNRLLYREAKKQYDTLTWTPDMSGVHTFCFSNEFSTFTHKVVYFAVQVGEDKPVEIKGEEHDMAMTLMDSLMHNIYRQLTRVMGAQAFFRNREAGGRQFAENLNLHVILWSLGETVAVLVVGLGQVLVLRSFFSGPSPGARRSASANGSIAT